VITLKRPLAFFDIEGTGLDLENDRVVEISICKYPAGDGKEEWFIQRFNLFNYDIPILEKEFQRCGLDLILEGRAMVDAGNIFKKKEERTLTAAVKFYTGRELENAHTATADVQGTADVFWAQLERYPDLQEMTMEEIGTFSRFGVDLAGKFGKDEDGDYVYNFKNKGEKVKENPGLARWMLGKGFTRDTKAWARRILEEIYEEARQHESAGVADAAPFGMPF
jgi:DNA polymerase-3 subunit epsilon